MSDQAPIRDKFIDEAIDKLLQAAAAPDCDDPCSASLQERADELKEWKTL